MEHLSVPAERQALLAATVHETFPPDIYTTFGFGY